MAVAILGHLLAAHVTAASEQDWSQGNALAEKVQKVTGDAATIVYMDQGYTGAQAAQDATAQHIPLEVVKWPKAKKGLGCCPSAGAWSVAMRGPRAFAFWREIMHSWPRRSLAFML